MHWDDIDLTYLAVQTCTAAKTVGNWALPTQHFVSASEYYLDHAAVAFWGPVLYLVKTDQ